MKKMNLLSLLILSFYGAHALASGSPVINCEFDEKDTAGNKSVIYINLDNDDSQQYPTSYAASGELQLLDSKTQVVNGRNVSSYETLGALVPSDNKTYGVYNFEDAQGNTVAQDLTIDFVSRDQSVVKIKASGDKTGSMKGTATLTLKEKGQPIMDDHGLQNRVNAPVTCDYSWE